MLLTKAVSRPNCLLACVYCLRWGPRTVWAELFITPDTTTPLTSDSYQGTVCLAMMRAPSLRVYRGSAGCIQQNWVVQLGCWLPLPFSGLFMAGEKIWHGKHRINIDKYDASKDPTGAYRQQRLDRCCISVDPTWAGAAASSNQAARPKCTALSASLLLTECCTRLLFPGTCRWLHLPH